MGSGKITTTKEESERGAGVESAAPYLSGRIRPAGCEHDAHRDRAEQAALGAKSLTMGTTRSSAKRKQRLLISEELEGEKGKGINSWPATS